MPLPELRAVAVQLAATAKADIVVPLLVRAEDLCAGAEVLAWRCRSAVEALECFVGASVNALSRRCRAVDALERHCRGICKRVVELL